ncbi:hypothetical protein QFC21_000317 [Naganishia friedmannii]|uniref:Uncharacterized protein n=1 Tax=Naganishia friedmannii TaxID=89922 RepID=A0ACC2WEM0_9TREE|nr:hypothetical protein QFC21_000317 [Naganishia friedmannii]
MSKSRSSSISSNELFEELENNIEQGEGKNDSAFDWGAFREARLQQMADDMERTKNLQRQGGTDGWYGSYREIKEERDLIQRSSLIGFEELGNDDNFSTAALEFRLKRSGVLPPPGYRKVAKLETLIPGKAKTRADNSDEDADSGGDERNTNTRRQKIIRSVRDNSRSRRGKAGDDSDDGWD